MKVSKIFQIFALLSLPFLMACGDDELEKDNGNGNDNKPNEEIKVDPSKLTGEVVLSVSKSLVEANGKDTTTFIVTQGGVEVTETAAIYVKNNNRWARYTETTFATTTEGSYEFSATHNGIDSESVVIQAATGLAELPADAAPEQFDGFRKRVFATQFTGTGCGYCPYVIKAIDDFQKTEKADDVVFAAVHAYNESGDPLWSDVSYSIAYYAGINGYPTLVYNMETSSSSETTAESIAEVADGYLASAANSNISAIITQEGAEANGSVTVQGAIKVAKGAQYKVGIWLLEDSIYAYQANYTNIQLDYTHNNGVRLANTVDPSGAQYGGRTKWNAEESVAYYHKFDLKNSGVVDLNNCHVVVYVTCKEEGEAAYTVDNVINCRIGETKTYEYTK